MCMVLIAGCSDKTQQTSGENDSLNGLDSVYSKLCEDTLWLSVWEFDTFNPICTKSSSVADCSFLVYDPLFAPEKNMKMRPVLAKSYSVSENGRRYTVKLNRDFKFHDGTEFGARDVLYTVGVLKDLGFNSLYYENISNIESIDAVDDETVVFKLYAAESLFTNNLCFPIVKKGTSIETQVKEPIGTGPYKFVKSNLVHAMYFEANEDYTPGKPQIKNAVVKILPEKQMQMYALQSRQTDAACVTSEELENYNPKGGVNTIYYNNRHLTYLGINTRDDFLGYSAVRRSINAAVNRADIVNSVLFGNGEPALLPYPNESYICPEEYKAPKRDIVSAVAMLDEVGFLADEDGMRSLTKSDGKVIKAEFSILVNSENEQRVAVAKKVCESLYQIGIKARIVKTDFETYKLRIFEGEYDMYIGEVKMDMSYMTTPLVGSDASYSIYSSKGLDDAIYKTLSAVGEEQTVNAYAELSEHLMEEMPIVSLYFGRDAMIISSKLDCGGYAISGGEFASLAKWKKEK